MASLFSFRLAAKIFRLNGKRALSANIIQNNPILPKINPPILSIIPSITPFTGINILPKYPVNVPLIDPIKNVIPVDLPELPSVLEKQAARLIVIRRRKMKKHKLKKLRKRMKFEWAKVRQRRELKKEKLFQAELIAQIKEAERFSAEAFVAEQIRKATEEPIPRFWKGKRLPEFIIRQKLGLPPKS